MKIIIYNNYNNYIEYDDYNLIKTYVTHRFQFKIIFKMT